MTVTPAVKTAPMPASYLKKASQAPGYKGTPDASPPTSPLAAAAGAALAANASKTVPTEDYLHEGDDLEKELAEMLADTELTESDMEE